MKLTHNKRWPELTRSRKKKLQKWRSMNGLYELAQTALGFHRPDPNKIAAPRRIIVRELALGTYSEFQLECGWCGAAFTKSWRRCPICQTPNSVRARADLRTSRYHFSEFR